MIWINPVWRAGLADYDHHGEIYQRWSERTGPYSVLEWHVFLEVLGSVSGCNVLDMACGDGRTARCLMELGAQSVLGVDVSQKMIDGARRKNRTDGGHRFDALRFETVDARDQSFVLDEPVDIVTAMYLFHYAGSRDELFRMCRFIGRNLKSGGRFVTYTINPDYDFERQAPQMGEAFGFSYRIARPPEYRLVIGDFDVPIWQWSKADHEIGLERAGLVDIRWHKLSVPEDRKDLERSLDWYLENPSCIVLSAVKA